MEAGVIPPPDPNRGVIAGDWIVYPSFFAGAVFNDNIYNTRNYRQSGVGMRLRPSFQADRDSGIHKTNVYANADIQIYPGHGQSYTLWPSLAVLATPTNVTGRVGFSHQYSPLPDLKFTVISDYTRANGGLFGGGFGAGAPLAVIPNASSLMSAQTYTNQFTGAVSVEKTIDKAFIRGSLGAQYVNYDVQAVNPWLNALAGNPLASNSPNLNSIAYTASLRGGYWIIPQVYAFVEPSGDFRRYANSWNNTNGYRIIGGFGSDLISLFRGEVYGGYQAQSSVGGRFGTVGSPAFGARLYYYPTRDLTFTASIDQTFTAPTAQTLSYNGLPWYNTASAPTRTLQARLQADYAITEYWTTYARGGWGRSHQNGNYTFNYANFLPLWTTGSNTTVWTAGAGMSYTFWRNVAVTMEYQFSSTQQPYNSNYWWTGNRIVQNLLSAGLTYKY